MRSVTRSDGRRDLISIVSSGWACARRGNSWEHGGAARFTQGEALDYIENGGDEKDSEGAGGEHATHYGRAPDFARDGNPAGSGAERGAGEGERAGRHQEGAET